jgi:hypothetical protein
MDFENGLESVGLAHGGHTVRVHGCRHGPRWTASIFPPPLFGSPALGAPSSAAAPPSPSLFHGRASIGDERLVPAPRRLNNGAQGLYSFARTPGTRRWGPGSGLEFPVGLSTARCAVVFRCAHDEGEARRGRDFFIHLLGDRLRAYDMTLNGASLLCKAAGVG